MRLFVGLDIPHEVKESLQTFVARLKPLAKIAWSPVENLHVTTKFVGEWPEARLDEMKRCLARIAKPGTIQIAVKGIGWFPDDRRPRVFWAGIEAGDTLHALARATDLAVSALAVPLDEREYSPHLTLARIRQAIPLSPLQNALRQLSGGQSLDFGTFQASEFFLYLSAGGKYTKLAEYPLS